jgi:ribosome maturation factor RimP
MREALERVVIEELAKLDYDLVELRMSGSRSRQLLDVRIDRRDLRKVSVEDCMRASRALEARLETEGGLVNERYVLEVSSPGVDRKLVCASDWKRFVGRKANVKAAAFSGRVEVEIVGVDGSDGSEVITVRDTVGVEYRVALAAVAEARLAVHWS